MPTFDDNLGFGRGCNYNPDDINIQFSGCESEPESWFITEVGSSGQGNNQYQSGSASAFGDDGDYVFNGLSSFTPPSYSYTGYMRLTVNCSDGSSVTLDSWTTQNGSPTRDFNHTYPNPCCPGNDKSNPQITIGLAGGIQYVLKMPKAVPRTQMLQRIIFNLGRDASGVPNSLAVLLVEELKKRGATIGPGGKIITPPSVDPTAVLKDINLKNPVGKTLLQAVLEAAKKSGATVIKAVPPPTTPTLPIIPFVIPLPLLPNWNPEDIMIPPGWPSSPGRSSTACNDPGTLNPGIGTAIASVNGNNTSLTLGDVYGSTAINSLASNNHVINAFEGVPPPTFPTLLVARQEG